MSYEARRIILSLTGVLKKVIHAVKRSQTLQGVVFATAVVLPLAIFLVSTSRVMLPINILPECCGWNYADTEWKPFNIQISDVVDFILPMKIYTHEALEAGIFPLWNPYFFGGGELFSNSQSAVLHPANLLYAVMGPLTAHTLSVLLSIYVMIFFSYILLRKIGCSTIVAGIGTLSYISIPWVIFWLEWGTIAWIMAVWPGILYFLYVFRGSGYHNFTAYTAATLLIGVQFYFGHMQFALFTLGIAALWWLVGAFCDKRWMRSLVLGLTSLLVAVLIGSVTIVNTVAMSQQGHRSGTQAVGVDAILKSDVQPQLSPMIVKVDPEFYIPNTMQTELTRGLLIVGVVMVVVAVVYRRGLRDARFAHFLAFLVALWFIGLGFAWSLPGFRHILDMLPVGKGMLHHYFIALSIFSAPFIAAIVLQKIISRARTISLPGVLKGRVKVSVIVVAIALFCVVLSAVGIIDFALDKGATVYTGYLPLVAVGLMVITLVLRRYGSWLWHASIGSVALTMLMSYFLYVYATTPMPNKVAYNVGNSLFQCIKDDAQGRGVGFPRTLSVLSSNSHMIYEVGVMSGYDSLYPLRTKLFHDAFNYPQKQRQVYGDNALLDVNFTKLELYKNLGINYVIAYKTDPQPRGFVPICHDPTERYQVYATTEKNEAIYAIRENMQLSETEQLEKIKYNSLAPYVMMSELPSGKYDANTVTSYSIRGNEIEAVVNTVSGGVVFISQTYNEGWDATVNGKNTKIYRANYNFMAVTLEPGTNTVKLRFTPKYLQLSIVMTSIGLLLLGGVWWFGGKTTRPHRSV